jgi:hypothetical protein
MVEESATPHASRNHGHRRWTPASLNVALLCLGLLACAGCGTNGSIHSAITVDSLADADPPPGGAMTLRTAIREIGSGGTITFDPSLNGGTIRLGIVGSDNSPLMGEIYGGTVGMTFLGYGVRNYGKSALYAAKDLTIDASSLPDGITLTWTGGDANRARVMAVHGNLTMRNVTVTSGHSSFEAIAGTQPYTLARGGGLAVWGTATLEKCTVSGNRCSGDTDTTNSRDRGTYGGGIFANALVMTNTVVSGNAVIGYGAAGGGIYSVGGADGQGIPSSLSGCTVSGNRVTAQHAYGGGIFTLGGGPNFLMPLALTNCTIARNVVEDHPGIGEPPGAQYYCRGGGVYMGGGYLSVTGCTVAENRVTGVPAIFSRKPNMGGGGIAATVGNAHVVEDISIRHSVVAGNTLNGAAEDLFTGSVLNFYSHGYNRIGRIDFSQILVPIPPWWSISRKHWPKTGDVDNVAVSDLLDLPNVMRHGSIRSVGTDDGELAALWYPPTGTALDQVPVAEYRVDDIVLAEYQTVQGRKDDFLFHVLDKLSTGEYGGILGSGFGAAYRATFEAANGASLDNVVWIESPAGWPSDARNIPWINFWRGLDNAIAGRLGSAGLGDGFWGSFPDGPLGDNVTMRVRTTQYGPVRLTGSDQLGNPRPYGLMGDIGAIERIP